MTNKITDPGSGALDRLGILNPSSRPEALGKSEGNKNTNKGISQAGFSELLVGKLDSKTAKDTVQNKVENAAAPAAELKFSAHATSRMSSRGIELSAEDIVKMQEAISRAGKKGAKESLVVTDKAAFVVSIKNNTVITAVDKSSLKENVFTNIDSTILI